jgi:hypothetical protein
MINQDPDSERVFALVTAKIAAHGDDVGAAVSAAIGWIAEHLPVYSANFVLTTATDLWRCAIRSRTSCGSCRGAPVARPVGASSMPAPTPSMSAPWRWRIGPAWSSSAQDVGESGERA